MVWARLICGRCWDDESAVTVSVLLPLVVVSREKAEEESELAE